MCWVYLKRQVQSCFRSVKMTQLKLSLSVWHTFLEGTLKKANKNLTSKTMFTLGAILRWKIATIVLMVEEILLQVVERVVVEVEDKEVQVLVRQGIGGTVGGRDSSSIQVPLRGDNADN